MTGEPVWSYEVRLYDDRWVPLWQARQIRDGRLVKSWLTDDKQRARDRCAVWEAARLNGGRR